MDNASGGGGVLAAPVCDYAYRMHIFLRGRKKRACLQNAHTLCRIKKIKKEYVERIQTFPQHTNLTTTREKLSVVLLVKCRVSLLFLLFFLDLATSAADPRLHPTLPSTLLSPLMSLASPGLFPPCSGAHSRAGRERSTPPVVQ